MSLQEHQAVDLYGVLWWRITPGYLLWYTSALKDIRLGPEASDTLVCCSGIESSGGQVKAQKAHKLIVSPRLPGYPLSLTPPPHTYKKITDKK